MAIALLEKMPQVAAQGSPAERPGEWRFHVVLLFVAVALGGLVQLVGPEWSRTVLERVKLDSWGGLMALLSALLASMMAHEMGHLLAALFLNYEVLGGAIGPFRFEFWRRDVLVRVERGNWSRCSISAVPREIHNGWRGRMMMVVAAGPAVSLMFLLAVVSTGLPGHSMNVEANWLSAFCSSCAEVNFFLFFLGLIPNGRSAAVRNDAALFLSLWQNTADAVDMFKCHQAIELSLRGVRPGYYPEPLLAELAEFRGRPHTNLMVARRMVEWATDSGDYLLAGKWDEAALAAGVGCSRRLKNATLAESACFDVLFRRDMRSAVHKFADVDFEELFPPSLAERAWAARLIACDLPNRAPAHIIRAQYQLPLGNPYYNYERMLLDKLHTRALLQTGSSKV